ncbi:MAG TPA: cation:proton antiporter [Candidatus Acidoferrales bacterium]|nr:cation:proton antiporter [Candidatus Acidoferrales bacterium]
MNAAFASACASIVSAALAGLPALPSISQIDPVAPVLLAIVFIIFAAMLGGLLMRRIGQPAVKNQAPQPGALREILGQLETLIVPIYFVLIGMQVKLESFTNAGTLWITAAFTVAAIAGKFVAGTVCIGRFRWMMVGVAMIPRGEVELIFASIGRSLGVVNDATFAAVVAMITTFVAPPLLTLTLGAEPLRH